MFGASISGAFTSVDFDSLKYIIYKSNILYVKLTY